MNAFVNELIHKVESVQDTGLLIPLQASLPSKLNSINRQGLYYQDQKATISHVPAVQEVKIQMQHIAEQVNTQIPEKKNKQKDKRKTTESDDDFRNIQVEAYNSAQLASEPNPFIMDQNYLKLYHLNPNFKFIYLNSYDKVKFDQIEEEFRGYDYIGLDSESNMTTNKATYLQLANDKFGAVINIRPYEMRADKEFQERIRRLFESQTIKKVGHSLSSDAQVLKRAFFGDIQMNNLYSLDDLLFTTRTNALGLSSICYRLFGYTLNKDYQSWIGEQAELVNDDELAYAIMDAVAPVYIYLQMKDVCEHTVPKETFFVNCKPKKDMTQTKFLLDEQLDIIKVFFLKHNLDSETISGKTYKGRPSITLRA